MFVLSVVSFVVCFITFARDTNAYSPRFSVASRSASQISLKQRSFVLRAESDDSNNLPSAQIAKMKALAAKLRSEAAELEAVQKESNLQSLSVVFAKFDTNRDGSISLKELRDGLANELQSAVSEEQALKIMNMFDTSGDGSIQLEEFPARGVDTFQNKMYNILMDEKKVAADAANSAREAKAESQQMDNILEMINNQPPTNTDKLLSLLPYLLPLLDVLPYGGKLIDSWNPEPNPLLLILGVIYQLYTTIPFSGLILFFGFNLVSNNLQLNRLVRFNIQQAILLDISLIIPGIIGSICEIVYKQTSGNDVPVSVEQASSAVTFLLVAVAIGYSVISTVAGQEPDKLPFISSRVKQRVPTTEKFKEMLKENMEQMKDREKGGPGGPKKGKDKDDKTEEKEDKDGK